MLLPCPSALLSFPMGILADLSYLITAWSGIGAGCPGAVVESPCLEGFKQCGDVALGDMV